MTAPTEQNGRPSTALSGRLFFAVWPDTACAQQLHEWAATLNGGGRARPVAAARLHLTLAFLGRLPLAQMPSVLAVGESASAAGGPTRLCLDRIECWPGPRVAVATAATPSTALEALAAGLRTALAAAGLPREIRPFRAHVTLLRHTKVLGAVPPDWRLDLRVNTLSLVESASDENGALCYRKLAEWPLTGVQKIDEVAAKDGAMGG